MRKIYVGPCEECNASLYWNKEEERLESSSDLLDHQCYVDTKKEEEEKEDGKTKD